MDQEEWILQYWQYCDNQEKKQRRKNCIYYVLHNNIHKVEEWEIRDGNKHKKESGYLETRFVFLKCQHNVEQTIDPIFF